MYSAISGLFGLVSGVLQKYFTSEDDKEKLAQALAEIKSLPELQESQQIDADNAEAKSSSVFVSGARAMEEWCFGIASFYFLVVVPLFHSINVLLPTIPIYNANIVIFTNMALMGINKYVNLRQ